MAAFGSPLPGASLYVGDLHPDVDERELDIAFRTAGPLISVHLCRDWITRASLCYAYVNYCFPRDACIALNNLNYTVLRGKPVRIMWSQRNPASRKTSVGNLFIKNLQPSMTSARLHGIFSKHGRIISCKISEANGKCRGYGYVQFDSEDSAKTALNSFNDTELDGKKLSVSKFVRKNERSKAEEGFTKLYVKQLDASITDDLLAIKFSEFGKVSSAVIVKDGNGKSKGFGFVRFYSPEDGKKAMEALSGQFLGSKKLFVDRARTKAERRETLRRVYWENENTLDHFNDSKLYVKNLHVSVDDRRLEKIFSVHGRVTSARVIRQLDGTSKGFGFVSYSSPSEAKKAFCYINGAAATGRCLCVAFARKHERRTGEVQKPCANFPTQTLWNSVWNFVAFNSKQHYEFRRLCSSIPLQGLIPLDPCELHRSFYQPFSLFNSVGGVNFQQILPTDERENPQRRLFLPCGNQVFSCRE